MQSDAITVRMCMLGAGGVGKSALTLQFKYEEFVEEYEPTKAAAYKKQVNVDGRVVDVDITDTAGQEYYAGIRDQYYRSNEGFLVVFSITDMDSLKAVPEFLDRIVQCRPNSMTAVVLVGNKRDLGEQRQVPPEMAMQLAHDWRIPYIETSAKTRENLEEAFMTLIRDLATQKINLGKQESPKMEPKKCQCCTIL
ncbi:unnamed protein product [Calicophoron daubneyi]|uniref:Uncharacterized protein n=1 Tax=Calicophoron daubneyi TaxID=300641 RepID=A0AAV2TT07_CALDB